MNQSVKNLFSNPVTAKASSVDSPDSKYVRWVCSRRTMVIKRKLKSKDIKLLYCCEDDQDSESDANSNSDDQYSTCGDESESEPETDSISTAGADIESLYKKILILIEFLKMVWFGFRFRIFGGLGFKSFLRFWLILYDTYLLTEN